MFDLIVFYLDTEKLSSKKKIYFLISVRFKIKNYFINEVNYFAKCSNFLKKKSL